MKKDLAKSLIEIGMGELFDRLENDLETIWNDKSARLKLARNISVLMAYRRMSAKDLGSKAGVDPSLVSRIVSGAQKSQKPSLYSLIRLSQALHQSVSVIFHADLAQLLEEAINEFEKKGL